MITLRAILFDVDDTLYSTTQFAALARTRSVQAMVDQGIDLPVETVSKELDEVIAEFTSNYSHHFDKLLLRLPPESWQVTNRALIVAAGVLAYHRTKNELTPFPDVLPFLQKVHHRGMPILGIVTHGLEMKQAEKLLLLGVTPYLHPDGIVISDQVGIAKPNPKIYQRALDDLGLQAGETLYVGDNPLHDIDPPNSLGMITARIHRENRFEMVTGETMPDYEIHSLSELDEILSRDFGFPAEG
ncbi:MAG: HAD-IA family hydrolase [Planctomycetota bacterium]|nr:HAD-IA family hydrolase [Planctomycetota bacterium]